MRARGLQKKGSKRRGAVQKRERRVGDAAYRRRASGAQKKGYAA